MAVMPTIVGHVSGDAVVPGVVGYTSRAQDLGAFLIAFQSVEPVLSATMKVEIAE